MIDESRPFSQQPENPPVVKLGSDRFDCSGERSSAGRALDCGSSGRGFDPHRSPSALATFSEDPGAASYPGSFLFDPIPAARRVVFAEHPRDELQLDL